MVMRLEEVGGSEWGKFGENIFSARCLKWASGGREKGAQYKHPREPRRALRRAG